MVDGTDIWKERKAIYDEKNHFHDHASAKKRKIRENKGTQCRVLFLNQKKIVNITETPHTHHCCFVVISANTKNMYYVTRVNMENEWIKCYACFVNNKIKKNENKHKIDVRNRCGTEKRV